MAQVSVRVNGYSNMLGCADGEEDHLRALAAELDQRVDRIKLAAGPSGEARLLLMAALVLSDELHDLRGQTGQPEDAAPEPSPLRTESKVARRLSRLARRAEAIADSAGGDAAGDGEESRADPAAFDPDDPDAAAPREEDVAAKSNHP